VRQAGGVVLRAMADQERRREKTRPLWWRCSSSWTMSPAWAAS
jgi:hypothetical protein